VDEVFVRIDGRLRYLYRAVDQDGQVLDILMQKRRNTKAAVRRFKSMRHTQLFLSIHGTIQNLFVIPRHLLRARHYRTFRAGAFDPFEQVTFA